MAILVLPATSHGVEELEFTKDLRLGTAAQNECLLPIELAVAPYHAVIARSQLYNVPVLINLVGETAPTQINGRQVVRLKVLRHRDVITLGTARLVFWEMMVREVTPGSRLAGSRCLVCYGHFDHGEHVITCPRCQSPHHEECWFYLTVCTYYGCGYPVQEAIRQVLAPWVRFETVTAESILVQRHQRCTSGTERDLAPFKAGDHVAYCPQCEAPFHVECWFAQARCPSCRHDIASLLQSVFIPGGAPLATHAEALP